MMILNTTLMTTNLKRQINVRLNAFLEAYPLTVLALKGMLWAFERATMLENNENLMLVKQTDLNVFIMISFFF